jgi:flavin reductase (DIM6/NTAB) family NADH-FMN oxidoreductase RutF
VAEIDRTDVAAVDPIVFRDALASLPSPVTIVTSATTSGAPSGATVSAFSSLSLAPPLVLVSLDLTSTTLGAIRERGAFAVHVLGEAHAALAMHFASKALTKFAELPFTLNSRGVPLFRDCALRFECVVSSEFDGGDHAILVGAVEGIERPSGVHIPVIWFERGFQPLQSGR